MATEIWFAAITNPIPGRGDATWSVAVQDGMAISMSKALSAEEITALRAGTATHTPATDGWDLARVNASLASSDKYHLALTERIS